MSVKDNTFGIAPIQDKMLSIFKHFKSICEQENLRYWAGTGTCLGAVRHNGFIPWDDDMDIYMPRKDYEKLWEIWEKSNTEAKYKLCRTSKGKNYRHRAMQIVDLTTTFINERCMNDDIEHGIYIDIIPMDVCPSNPFSRVRQIINAILYSIYNIQIPPDFQGGRLMRTATKALLGLVKSPERRYKIWKRAERQLSKYKEEKNEYYTDLYIYFWMIFKKLPKKWFETEEIKYEDTTIKIPSGYDDYLRILYGNYMELPSEKDRGVKHHTVKIDVDNSYVVFKGKYYLSK